MAWSISSVGFVTVSLLRSMKAVSYTHLDVYKRQETVLAAAHNVLERLDKICRVELDSREGYSPGWKFNEWELRGVPIRLEIGPRDVKAGKVVMVRRDTGEKTSVPLENLENTVTDLLNSVQAGLYACLLYTS